MSDFSIRKAKEEEYPFIYNSFLKSLRQSPPYSLINSNIFYGEFHDLMEAWLRDAGASVAVVKTSDGSEEIIGWSVICNSTLLYVYVKKDFRGMGIARALLGVGEDPKEFFSPLSSAFLDRVPATILTSRLVMIRPRKDTKSEMRRKEIQKNG